ncbi:MAG: DUF998 domain-containing protein [Promethearchaeota archaeon]|nr:MAG: DUF998 domain-containing protein [Candidatus Lokiarchaeota archaeon]
MKKTLEKIKTRLNIHYRDLKNGVNNGINGIKRDVRNGIERGANGIEGAKKIVKEQPIPKKHPISVVSGIAAIVIFWSFILFAFALYPGGFNPLENWMSDLGNLVKNPNGAYFFNLGCIISGICLFFFFIGLYEWYIGGIRNKILTILTQFAGFISALSLMMIGFSPINYFKSHMFWALIFFTVSSFVSFFPSVALYKFKFTRNTAKFGFLVCAFNVFFRFFVTIPIFEWIAIFLSFSFILVIIYSMQKRVKRFRAVRNGNIVV